MNISEKALAKKSLTRLISRLEELSSRDIEVEEGWYEISENISKVHTIFVEVVQAFILECKRRLDELDSTLWPYHLLDALIEYLYRSTFLLRWLYAHLFTSPSPDRLYFYLFFSEIRHCFRNVSVVPTDIGCVMIGTGSMAHWALDETLVGKIRSFRMLLHPEARDKLDRASANAIAGFECDFQEYLDRQMILTHELFHLIVRKNPDIKTELTNIAANPSIQGIFTAAGHSPLNEGQIEELFCDFGSAWFFGPIYVKAFLEEIVFREKGGSSSHPHRMTRLQMLLCYWPKKKKYHPYIQDLSEYIKIHKSTTIVSLQDVQIIATEFRSVLIRKGFKRYAPLDDTQRVKWCLDNNTSYIYSEQDGDLRKLFNSIPNIEDLAEKARKNYQEFLLESIRKNVMWREFQSMKKELKPALPGPN